MAQVAHHDSCEFCAEFIRRFSNGKRLDECNECGFSVYNAGCTNPECEYWWVRYIDDSDESYYICEKYREGKRCVTLAEDDDLLRECAQEIDDVFNKINEYMNNNGVSYGAAKIGLIRLRKNKQINMGIKPHKSKKGSLR
jgi:hypothetical protein